MKDRGIKICGIIMIITAAVSIFLCIPYLDTPTSFYDPLWGKEINEYANIGALTGIISCACAVIAGIGGLIKRTGLFSLIACIITAVFIIISAFMLKCLFILTLLPLCIITLIYLLFSAKSIKKDR